MPGEENPVDEFRRVTAAAMRAIAERDDITGFVWFDVAKEADWSISSSPEAEEAFLEGIADPVFGG